MNSFLDQLNRKIVLNHPPRRIISLVPSQTELLVDLGLEERIFGVTKFCVHPKGLRKEKTVVGGTKKVHLNRIEELHPDLILCNKEENTAEMVAALEKIAPVHVSDVKTIEDSLALIKQYGEIFGAQSRALGITKKISLLVEELSRDLENKPFLKVAYFIWKNPWMVAGADNFIDHLLRLNHFENIYSHGESRYPEVSLESLREKQVDLIFLSTEPFPFKEKDKILFSKEARMDCIHVVDGEYFSWYGTRLLSAFRYFRALQEDIRPS